MTSSIILSIMSLGSACPRHLPKTSMKYVLIHSLTILSFAGDLPLDILNTVSTSSD